MTVDSRTVPARFAALAALHPERLALVTSDSSLTYADLSRLVASATHAFTSHGVRPGDRIGIGEERSTATVVAMLAAFASGCAYLYLDPAFGPGRLAAMADDADLSWSTGPSSGDPRFGSPLRIPTGPAPTDTPSVAARWEDLAYMKFTSGSTGRAKGVPVSHANLACFLDAMDDFLAVTRPVRWLAAAAFSFDVSILDLYWPLSRGHTVVLNTDRLLTDVALADLAERWSPTHLQLTPTVARHLVGSPLGRSGLARLDHLMVGGEHLPPTLARALMASVPGRVTNIYGPTETTVWATGADLAEPVEPITVGRPFRGVQVEVVDADYGPMPDGDVGELVIGGPMVTGGYLKRPELTSARFIQRSGRPEGLWYVTGDLARFLPDGRLELHGRTDHQVKVHGVRVELGEVEAVLERHPGVSQAVVVPRPTATGDTALHAYVVAADPAAPPPPSEVLALARRHLVPATVPPHLGVVDRFPLTATGKVDRAALAATPPVLSTRPAASAVDAHADAMVREVVAMVAATLGVDVRPDDDFFDLGGNSLDAVQLVHRLEERHHVRLAVSMLAESPTPRRLAALVRERPASRSLVVLAGDDGDDPPLAIVHGQAGNVLAFRDLARALRRLARPGHVRPVFGFQAFGVDGAGAPDATVAAMAERYVTELVAVRPHGPFVLSGYSAGGAIALEMARVLEARDLPVLVVLLLDADHPAALGAGPVEQVRRVVRRVGQDGPGYLVRWGAAKASRYRYDRQEVAAHAGDPVGDALAERTTATITAALASATPVAPEAPVVLVRARDLAATSAPDLGWSTVFRDGVDISWVPGDHRSMFEHPHVDRLARAVLAEIDRFGGSVG